MLTDAKLKSWSMFHLVRLKERMRDLDKPLMVVNRSLWEEMRSSTEKEVIKDKSCTKPVCEVYSHFMLSLVLLLWSFLWTRSSAN